MFGLGGNIKQFGMGVALNFANNAHSGMKSATSDFRQMSMQAKKTDAEMAALYSNLSKGSRDIAKGFGAIAVGGGMMAAAVAMSMMNQETEKLYSNYRTLGVLETDRAGILKNTVELEGQLRDMMRNFKTAIPKEKMVGGFYNLKSMGISDTKEIIDTTKALAITANAGIGTYEDALNSFRLFYMNFANKSGKPLQSSLQDFQDVFPSVIMQYNTTLPMLSEQFAKAGGSAAAMGWNVKETASALGLLISAGLNERSGTSIDAMTRDLKKAGDDLGLSFIDAKNRALPLIEIIGKVRNKFGSIDAVEKSILNKAFGEEGSRGVVALSENFDKLRDSINKITPGLGLKMHYQAVDNLKDKTTDLSNSWSTLLGITSGTGLNMKQQVDSLSSFLDQTSLTVEKHPGLGKSFIYGLFGLGGFISSGGGIWVIKKSLEQWKPIFTIIGAQGGKIFAGEFGKAVITFFGSGYLLASVVAAIGPVGAYMKSNKFLRDLGIDPKTGKPISLEVFDPSTGQTYHGRRTGLNAGLGQMPQDDEAASRQALDRAKKFGDVRISPKSINLSQLQMQGNAPVSGPTTTTYQDNRKIEVKVEAGSLNNVQQRNIQLMTEALQRQLDEDAEYRRLRHGASPEDN